MTKTKEKKVLAIPSFVMGKTNNKDIFRFVDRHGNWTHYFIKSKKDLYVSITNFLGVGYPKGEGFMRWALGTTKEEAQKILEEAGDSGSKSHDAVDLLIKGEKIEMDRKFKSRVTDRYEVMNPKEWRNVETWVNWCNRYKLRVITSEYTTGSHSMHVAGTLDTLGVVTVPMDDKYFPKNVRGKDVLILLDWKFSSGIYESYKAQVATYDNCLRENKEFTDFYKEYKGRIFTGVVRGGTRHVVGYEMQVWGEDETAMNLKKAKSALVFYHDLVGNFKPKVVNIPTEFEVKVSKVVLSKKKKVIKKKTPIKKVRAKKVIKKVTKKKV